MGDNRQGDCLTYWQYGGKGGETKVWFSHECLKICLSSSHEAGRCEVLCLKGDLILRRVFTTSCRLGIVAILPMMAILANQSPSELGGHDSGILQ